MDIYETLRLWAVLSPCQHLPKAEADDRGKESEGLEGEQSPISKEFCNPLGEDDSVH